MNNRRVYANDFTSIHLSCIYMYYVYIFRFASLLRASIASIFFIFSVEIENYFKWFFERISSSEFQQESNRKKCWLISSSVCVCMCFNRHRIIVKLKIRNCRNTSISVFVFFRFYFLRFLALISFCAFFGYFSVRMKLNLWPFQMSQNTRFI